MKIVVGMHRSGTSLLMNLMQRVGADLGDPRGFYPCDRWNPDGYFEQQSILEINRRLLHGLWGRAAFFFPPSDSTILARGKRLERQLRALTRQYQNKLVKDPRFLFTGLAWENYGAEFSHVLVTLRHPNQVAASMGRRNRLPRFLAMRMIAEHYRRILSFTRNRQTHWVNYDHLVAPNTSVAEFASAARFVGLSFRPEVDSIWYKNLVRMRSSQETGLGPPLPIAVNDLWGELCERHLKQRE